MADIKKNRTQAKGKLTRSAKDLQEILNKTENVTLDKIRHYISEFQDKLKSYDDKQNEFELSFENEDDMLAEKNSASKKLIYLSNLKSWRPVS